MTLRDRLKRLRSLTTTIAIPGGYQLALAGIIAVVVVLLLIIFLGGKHEKQKAADQVAIAPVTAKKSDVQQGEAAHVTAATEEVHVNVAKVRERSRRDVETLHAAVAAAPPGDPDGAVFPAYYERVCKWRFYTRDADCLGYGGGPQGSRPPAHP